MDSKRWTAKGHLTDKLLVEHVTGEAKGIGSEITKDAFLKTRTSKALTDLRTAA
jgi:hypothetical protein